MPKRSKNINEITKSIKNSRDFFTFKYYKDESMSEEDKKRVEYVMIVMITRIKYTPLEIGNQILNDLYQRIDS